MGLLTTVKGSVLNREINVKDSPYNAKGDGIADDTAALQAAITACDGQFVLHTLYLPVGIYRVTSSLTIADGRNFKMEGEGRKSKIVSEVTGGGATLIATDCSLATFHNFAMEGNSLTGASGNGNAIYFRDSDGFGTGTFFPQITYCTNLYIDGFAGDMTDVFNDPSIACGIYATSGLALYIGKSFITECGDGVRFDTMQQSYIEKCAITSNERCGVMLFNTTEGVHIKDCDIISNAVSVATFAIDGGPTYDSADVFARACDLVTVNGSKLKNTQYGVFAVTCDKIVVEDNSIKPLSGADFEAVWTLNCSNVTVDDNFFLYVNASLKDYGGVLYDATSSDGRHMFTMRNNVFSIAGDTIRYCAKVKNTGNDRSVVLDISGNNFGDPRRAQTTIVTTFLELGIGEYFGAVDANNFIASTGITVTNDITFGGINKALTFSGNNPLESGGGVITNKFAPASQILKADDVIDSAACLIHSAQSNLVTTTASVPTLADGFEGQEKIIYFKTDVGNAVLTPANLHNGTTITFANIGEAALLKFTNSKWLAVSLQGAVLA